MIANEPALRRSRRSPVWTLVVHIRIVAELSFDGRPLQLFSVHAGLTPLTYKTHRQAAAGRLATLALQELPTSGTEGPGEEFHVGIRVSATPVSPFTMAARTHARRAGLSHLPNDAERLREDSAHSSVAGPRYELKAELTRCARALRGDHLLADCRRRTAVHRLRGVCVRFVLARNLDVEAAAVARRGDPPCDTGQ